MSEFTLAENIELDLNVHQPLERVNYEAGMLLGLEATRAEQAYHRQRVNRLQYWFQGAGTLLGLVVKQSAEDKTDDGLDKSVRLVVSPGIAIDGLGRELLCYEPYCVNLRDWLDIQKSMSDSFLYSALSEAKNSIQLMVTISYQSAVAGLQPVMTRKVNAGIDPVQPSRAKDALLLEIIPGAYVKPTSVYYRAGLSHLDVDQNTVLTNEEESYLATLNNTERKLKAVQTQLLYGISDQVGALELKGAYEDLARVLLATIEIPIRTELLPAISPIINPNKIRINNLIRPFITTNDQLAGLLQEMSP